MRYRRAVGAAVWIGMLVAAGPAEAAEPPATEPPLAFAETTALQTTCAKLASGVNVGIRNETAARQRVRVVPVEFKDSTGAGVRRKAVCGGLSIKVARTLRGGRGATAILRAKRKRAGSFSGSLLLLATRGKVTRREVSISPKAAGKTLEAEPLVGSATEALREGDRGPIWVPVEGSPSDLPRPASAGPLTVGAVAGANGTAAILYGGRRRVDDAAAEVKLELDTGLPAGAYAGTVDLNPSDDEAGDVSLDLKVSGWWVVAALLLIAGIVLSLFLQRLTGRLIPRARLRARIRGLSERHDEAVKALKAPPGDGKEWVKFRVENLEPLQTELENQLTKATKSIIIKIEPKVLESLESAIAVVEAQVDLLKEIPTHAGDLEEELQELDSSQSEGFDLPPGATGSKPALFAAAHEALAGGPVKAAKLKLRIEEIDARAKQVRVLAELVDRLADLSAARKTLQALNDPDLVKVDTKLTAIRFLLWTAASAADLDTAANEIQATAKTIAELWHRLNRPQPPVEVMQLTATGRYMGAAYATATLQPEFLSEETAIVEAFEVPPGAEAAPTAPRPVPDIPPPPALDAESIEREVRRAFLGQFLALLIGAVVAVATGLAFLYTPNATWGSDWDYLAAVVWGLGVQATVSTLATSLDGLGLIGMLRRG